MAEQRMFWWKPNVNASLCQNLVQLSPWRQVLCVVVILRVALLGFLMRKWIAV
jgi:hypothetical protein